MSTPRLCLLSAGLLLALDSPLFAAGSLDPPDLSRYLRWGPLRARPGLELTNLGYDDNIFADDPQVGDYTVTVTPRIEGLLLFGDRAFLTFEERLELTGYLHNGDQNFANQRGSGRVTVPFGSFGVFSDFALNHVQDRAVDRQDLRPEHTARELGAGVIVGAGWRTELELSHSGENWSYSDPDLTDSGQTIGERLDRTEKHDTLRARYLAFGRTHFLLDARSSRIDFDQPDADGASKDSVEHSLLGGVDFGEGGSLSGRLRTGWATIDSRDPRFKDFSSPVADTELAFRPLARTTFRVGALRMPGLTVSGSSTYYVETRYRLRAIYYLNRIVGFEAGSSVGKLTFPGQAEEAERLDRLFDYDVALRLRLSENSLGRRVEYALRYSHYDRDSTEDSLDESRNTLGIDAVVGF